MTLPSSGTITAGMINVELGRSASAVFHMDGAAERALAGHSSGTYSMSDFYERLRGALSLHRQAEPPPSRTRRLSTRRLVLRRSAA